MQNETEAKLESVPPVVKTTMISMCLSIRGAINNLNRQSSRKSGFTHPDGKPMTKDQAIDALMDELAKGNETMPMNPKCDNPCKNSTLCAGFNFGKDGGCPGYPVEMPAQVSAS